MGFIDKIKMLFIKKQDITQDVSMPSWEEIVCLMQKDKPYCKDNEEIIDVIYSNNKEDRIIIIKDGRGFFRYRIEHIEAFTDDEWMYIAHFKDILPGMWSTLERGVSLFASEDLLWNELKNSPEYKEKFGLR